MSHLQPQFNSVSCRPIGDADCACEACAYWLASEGETPDDAPRGWNPPEIDDDTEYREVEGAKSFSHSPCDFCGDPLGGDRYDFEQLEFGNFYQWRLSAPGYSDCTDWSYAESLSEAVYDCWLMYGDEFERFGSLFHYARNGHGVSWLDDFSEFDAAQGLQEASAKFGELELDGASWD